MPIYRGILSCDRAYCLLVTGDIDGAIEVYCRIDKKFMKAMKNFIGVIRTQYAYALLVRGDTEKAEKIRKYFDKVSQTYPYSGEKQTEAELMDLALSIYTKNKEESLL